MTENHCLCEKTAGSDARLHPKCFGQVWLFEGTPPAAWDSISTELTRRQCAAEEVIFRQGDKAESMYLIKMDSVKLWKLDEDGRELTLDIRKEGDLLGESVLIEEGQYPVFASALTPTLICGIDRSTFETLVKSYPQVGLAVIRNLSRRIDYLTGTLDAFAEPSIEEKLYKVLVNVAEQVGTPESGGWSLSFPLTHEEIGFLVGAHRVSITRALKKLKTLGKVKKQGKSLFVARAA